ERARRRSRALTTHGVTIFVASAPERVAKSVSRRSLGSGRFWGWTLHVGAISEGDLCHEIHHTSFVGHGSRGPRVGGHGARTCRRPGNGHLQDHRGRSESAR